MKRLRVLWQVTRLTASFVIPAVFPTSLTAGWQTRVTTTPLTAPATAATVEVSLVTTDTWTGSPGTAAFDDVRLWEVP